MNNLKETKLNNKGFSLVELIIVIAIMAVLIGVLAPQYIKYVEKSRVATDRDNITAIVDAVQVWAVDPDATSSFSGTTTVSITGSTSTATGAVADALGAAGISTTLPALTNRQTFDTATITITVASNGTVSVSTAFTKSGTQVTF